MPISVRCQCGQRFNAKDELGGKTVKCPKCGQPLTIPRPEPVAPVSDELELEPVGQSSWMDDLLGGQPPAPAPGTSKPAPAAAPGAAGPAKLPAAQNPAASAPAGKAPAGKSAAAPSPATLGKKSPALKSSGKSPAAGMPAGPTDAQSAADDRTTKLLLIGGGVGGALVLLVLGGLIGYQMFAGEGPTKTAPVDPRVAAAFGENAASPAVQPAEEETPAEGVAAAEGDNSPVDSDAPAEAAPKQGVKPASSQATDEELAGILPAVRDTKPLPRPKLNVDAKVLASIKQAFDELGEALKSGGEHEITASFDFERVRELAEKLGNVHVPPQHRAEALERFGPSMSDSLTSRSRVLAWSSYEIRRIDLSEDGNEAEVLVRHNQLQDRTAKFRWWLVKDNDRWRFYDFENLLFGIPYSTTVVYVFGEAAEVQKMMERHEAFQGMADALYQGNLNTLGQSLDVLDEYDLDEQTDAIRHFVRGLWHLKRGEPDDALKAFSRAEKVHGDMPALMIERADAHNTLGDGKQALDYVRDYEQRVGRDDDSWRQIGRALIALGRKDDGLLAFRRGLAYNPKSIEVLYELAVNLPKNQRKELAECLKPSAVGPYVPQYVAGLLQQNGQEETLQYVFDLMQQFESDPNAAVAEPTAASDDAAPESASEDDPAPKSDDADFDPFAE